MAVCGILTSREEREGIWGGIASQLQRQQTVIKVQQFAKLSLVLTTETRVPMMSGVVRFRWTLLLVLSMFMLQPKDFTVLTTQ